MFLLKMFFVSELPVNLYYICKYHHVHNKYVNIGRKWTIYLFIECLSPPIIMWAIVRKNEYLLQIIFWEP